MFDIRPLRDAVASLYADISGATIGHQGDLDGWVDLVADCQSVLNTVSAVQLRALAAAAHCVERVVDADTGAVETVLDPAIDPREDIGGLVSGLLGVPDGAATDRVHHAVRLTRLLPEVLDLVADGSLTEWQARLVSAECEDNRVHGRVPDDVARAASAVIAADLATRLGQGRVDGPARLRHRIRHLVTTVAPDCVADPVTEAPRQRGLTRWSMSPALDQWTLTLPTGVAGPLWARIDAAARRLRDAGEADTLVQARADAFVAMATEGGDPRFTVLLAAPAGSAPPAPPAMPSSAVAVSGLLPGAASLVSWAWLDGVLARATTTVRPVACDPTTGALVPTVEQLAADAARTLHDPTREQVEWVRARDGHCRFPGCTTHWRFCDVDHVRAWGTGPRDGRTVRLNLMLLCRRHHRVKQQPGWRVRLRPDGIVEWRDPTGRTWLTSPVDHLGLPPPPGPDAEVTSSLTPADDSDEGQFSVLEFLLEHRLSPDLSTPALRRAGRRGGHDTSGPRLVPPRFELSYAGPRHALPPDVPPF